MKKLLLILFSILISKLLGQNNHHFEQSLLFQVSIIDSLYSGNYDGKFSVNDLMLNGDFGLGTFDKLDGEMIVLEGKAYQFKADGKIYENVLLLKTPFAVVVKFKSDTLFKKSCLNEVSIINFLDSIINNNYFYAIKLHGKFSFIAARTVDAQSKPYKPLIDVLKNQIVFEKNNLEGTLVGFYCPQYFNKINVSGYHFHFISDDKNFGGHVLSFYLIAGNMEIQKINCLKIFLPN